MSWFRSKRKIATEAATQSLRPLIGLAQMSGGMSLWMWRDPYLLGYMTYTASFYAKAETNGKASHTDIGFALMDAFSNVSNINGQSITETSVVMAEAKNEDYQAGSSDAMTVAMYSAGIIDNNVDDPLIRLGKAHADAMGGMMGPDYNAAVVGGMIHGSFVERVKEMRKDENA